MAPGYEDHLWRVISDPTIDAQCVVIVFFLTWQPHYDQACIVQSGEHPFVKHSTCVNYPAAKVTSNLKLDEALQQGRVKLKTPLSPELLEKIRRQAAESDIMTEACDILRRQGLTG